MLYHQLNITITANIFAIWCLLVIYRQCDVVPLGVLNCAGMLSAVHVGIGTPGYWKPVWNPHRLVLLIECFPELGGLTMFCDFFRLWTEFLQCVPTTLSTVCRGGSRTDAPWCCCSKVSYNTDEYIYSRDLTLYWIHCFNWKV